MRDREISFYSANGAAMPVGTRPNVIKNSKKHPRRVIELVSLLFRAARDDRVAWQNPVPGSTKYCRPIKFIFGKETVQNTKTEVACVEAQIAVLQPSVAFEDNIEIHITHKLVMTMVDVKVINALTDTRSSQRCYICQTTSKARQEMAQPPMDIVDNYRFGLSTLYLWIRALEFLLNVSYRLDLKKELSTMRSWY